jgi:transcriptional regulator with XRE-family HTH domain
MATATPEQLLRYGHIAALLREKMAERHMTIRQLATALGLQAKNTTPYTWIQARGAPRNEQVAKLARLFNISPEQLVPRTASDAPPTVRDTVSSPVVPGPRSFRNTEALAFLVSAEGDVTIRLNITLPLPAATTLLRTLLDAGIVSEGTKPG